jgi:hypothetical protein
MNTQFIMVTHLTTLLWARHYFFLHSGVDLLSQSEFNFSDRSKELGFFERLGDSDRSEASQILWEIWGSLSGADVSTLVTLFR